MSSREQVSHDEQTRLLAIIMGAVAGLLLSTFLAVQVAAVFSCGTFMHPGSGFGMLSAFNLEGDNRTGWQVGAGQCFPSAGAVWGSALAIFTVLLIAAVAGSVAWRTYKQGPKWLLRDLAKREGIAQSGEVNKVVGPRAYSKKRRKQLRPSVANPSMDDASMRLGVSQKTDVRISMEDSVLVYGPPRSGKGFFVAINMICNAPGAVISSSTRPDNMALTRDTREKLGPIAVFDPSGLSGAPQNAKKWSPIAGCESPEVANRRAGYLMKAAPMGQSGSNAEWSQKSEVIFARLLHAAALAGVGVDTLYQWTTSAGNAQAAVKILKEHPGAEPFWAESLEGQLSTDPKLLASMWFGVSAVGDGLDTKAVREWMSPRTEEERLDVRQFILNKGTLYLLGDQTASAAISPWLIALLNDFYDTAQELAAGSQTAPRLDPPLTLVLDEAANVISKWEKVPSIMSAGGGSGIVGVFFFQSPSQIRSNWGDKEAEVVFDNATCKIQLGGSSLAKDLKEISDLMGERRIDTSSETRNENWKSSKTLSTERASVMSVDEMRRIPFGHALVFYKSARPMIVKLGKWSDRKDADELRASAKKYAEQQKALGKPAAGLGEGAEESGLSELEIEEF